MRFVKLTSGSRHNKQTVKITERTDQKYSLKGRAELTAVRFIPAFFVMIAHNSLSWEFGFSNIMPFFFLLSGFLITINFISEFKETKTINLKNFYIRRILRIMPVMYAIMIVVLLYGFLTHAVDYLNEYIYSALASIFLYSSYWSLVTYPFNGMFSQLWSLSVDEQFYLIWAPTALFCLYRYRTRVLMWLCIFLTFASTADSFITYYLFHNRYRAYYSLDTRASSLFAGCILAILFSEGFLNNLSKTKRFWINLYAVISLGLITWILLTVPMFSEFSDTWGLLIFNVSCFGIVSYVLSDDISLIKNILRLRFFVHLGKISLSTYIWFWPVFLTVTSSQTHLNSWYLFILRFTLVIVLSEITYWLVEVPTHKLRKSRFKLKIPASEVAIET